MALSGHRLDPEGAAKWHRVAGVLFPSWAMARHLFLMNERRCWRKELAARLGMAKNHVARLLRSAARPHYAHYLNLLGFLEEHGVATMIRLPDALAPPPAIQADYNPLADDALSE